MRHYPLGETDRIVVMLTREFGKRRFISKGARRPGSRFAGHLEPGAVAACSAARGRSLDIVSQATLVHSFRRLRDDMRTIAYASILLDLSDSLTADDEPAPRIFDLLQLALGLLDGGSEPLKVLLLYEYGLLREVGYRPELYMCIRCSAQLSPVVNGFSFDAGGVLCHDCRRVLPSESVTVNALKVLRLLDRGEFRRFERVAIPDATLREVDSILAGFVRSILGKDSPARRVLREMQIGYDEDIEHRNEPKGANDVLR